MCKLILVTIACFTTLCLSGQVNGVEPISIDLLKEVKIVDLQKYQRSIEFKTKNTIANSFNFNELSPFCKIEHFANRNARLPVKFRLGSVEYVDRLESKTKY